MTKGSPKRPRLAEGLLFKENIEENADETADDEKDKSLEFCRLRHGLNDDCLCSVFDYLSIADLVGISQLDTYFLVLIRERVIIKKLVSFNDLLRLPTWMSDSIYKQFGKNMLKISVTSELVCDQDAMSSFERFLTLITTHCSTNMFTKVELKLNRAYVKDPNLIRLSLPYFINVHNLALRSFCIERKSFDFFAGLGNIVKELKTLTLDCVYLNYQLHDPEIFDLSVFLKSKRKLETFNYCGNDDISPMMVDALKQDCANLKTFVHIFYTNQYTYLDTISDKMKNRYNYLCEIVNLKNVTMTSHTLCGSDLYVPLQKLAAKNKLETLKVYMEIGKSMELSENERLIYAQQSFSHTFSSLTTIEIKIESDRTDNHDMKFYFLCHFMSKLKSLNQVRIISRRINNLNQILEIAPNIHVMCLAQVTMKHLPVEMKKIVRSAKKVREQQLGEDLPLLHLILSRSQWREIQVYKDIDSIITFEIDDTNYYGINA